VFPSGHPPNTNHAQSCPIVASNKQTGHYETNKWSPVSVPNELESSWTFMIVSLIPFAP